MIRRLAVALSVPAVLVGQQPLKRQIDSLHASMTAAFNASPPATAAFYADDAAMIGGGMRVSGREGIDRYWGRITPTATWKLEVLDVGGDDASPWVHGRSTFAPPGAPAFISEYIGLLQRGTDGKLRFRVDAYAQEATAPASPAADEAAVRGIDSLWARMYAKHDTTAALQLYSDQLVFISANGRQKTRAEELADVRPAAGLVMKYFRTTPAEVRAFGQVAVVRGVADWRFTMNGSPREIHRPYTAVYTRGGPLGWRIVAIQMR
jgi:ketosteroid isomerase-like protein